MGRRGRPRRAWLTVRTWRSGASSAALPRSRERLPCPFPTLCRKRNLFLLAQLSLLCRASCDICHPALMTISTGGPQRWARVWEMSEAAGCGVRLMVVNHSKIKFEAVVDGEVLRLSLGGLVVLASCVRPPVLPGVHS